MLSSSIHRINLRGRTDPRAIDSIAICATLALAPKVVMLTSHPVSCTMLRRDMRFERCSLLASKNERVRARISPGDLLLRRMAMRKTFRVADDRLVSGLSL